MKKFFMILMMAAVTAAMCVAFAACGGDGAGGDGEEAQYAIEELENGTSLGTFTSTDLDGNEVTEAIFAEKDVTVPLLLEKEKCLHDIFDVVLFRPEFIAGTFSLCNNLLHVKEKIKAILSVEGLGLFLWRSVSPLFCSSCHTLKFLMQVFFRIAISKGTEPDESGLTISSDGSMLTSLDLISLLGEFRQQLIK